MDTDVKCSCPFPGKGRGLIFQFLSAFPRLRSAAPLSSSLKRHCEAAVWPILRRPPLYGTFDLLQLAYSSVIIGSFGWLNAHEKQTDLFGRQSASFAAGAHVFQVASVAEAGMSSSAYFRLIIVVTYFSYMKNGFVSIAPQKRFLNTSRR